MTNWLIDVCDIAKHWKFHLLGNNDFVIMSLTVNVALPVLGTVMFLLCHVLSCFYLSSKDSSVICIRDRHACIAIRWLQFTCRREKRWRSLQLIRSGKMNTSFICCALKDKNPWVKCKLCLGYKHLLITQFFASICKDNTKLEQNPDSCLGRV